MTRLVSLVLPVYNEERTMESAAAETIVALESFLPDDVFEIIFAEIGSNHVNEVAPSVRYH
jgi:glycosyltransferase AglD